MRLVCVVGLLVGCLGVATPRSSPAQPVSPLRVQGSRIVDEQGRTVLLRGINLHTYYYRYLSDPSAPWTYAKEEDIAFLADLGVRAIRLALHWRYFDSPLGWQLIDTYLAWCEAAGIYVILDLHVVPPEADILEGKIWDDPAAQERFLELWRAIAARYADRAIVAGYDLFNEPNPPDPAQWWALAERARAAIRAVDPSHILFVEAPLSGEGVNLRLLDDPQVVYSYHEYRPFVVSHAGVDWIGDTPVPDDFAYPGPVLIDVRWLASSTEQAEFTGRSSGWIFWEGGRLTVPAGAEWASLIPYAWGNVGEVEFDDLALLHNGQPWPVFNAGFEKPSVRAGLPAGWSFGSDSGFSGFWREGTAHGGRFSVAIVGEGNGYGEWSQANWILIKPLVPVRAGDVLRPSGWLRAPRNAGGGAGIGLNFFRGIYERYDRDRLRADLEPYVKWAAAHNVPLYIGEFGAMSLAPGESRPRLIEDWIAVMNEAGLHWTLWAYRDGPPPSFGLVFPDGPDARLVEILRRGLSEGKTLTASFK